MPSLMSAMRHIPVFAKCEVKLRPVARAYLPISQMWKHRLRSLALQRSLEYFGFILMMSIGIAWLLFAVFRYLPLDKAGGVALQVAASAANLSTFFGIITVILAILCMFTYAVAAIQAWTHWAISIVLSASIVACTFWLVDIKLWLTRQAVWLFPSVSRQQYLETIDDMQPVLAVIVAVGALSLPALSLYVQVRGVKTVLKCGNKYTSTRFIKNWSSPLDPMPHAWQLQKWRERFVTRLDKGEGQPSAELALRQRPTRKAGADRKSKRKQKSSSRRRNRK